MRRTAGSTRQTLARLVPPEGLLTVALVYLMGVTVALAIDDARWFLGDETIQDFLPLAMIGGMTVELVAARVGWSRWTGHLIGAAFAALLIPLWVGERLPPADVTASGAWFHELYTWAAREFVEATRELVERQRVLAHQFGPTLLAFGLIIWATGMFASAAVFRHRRPLAAISALGILLLVNILITIFPQLGYLVLFSAAALLLLVRLHAVDEQAAWLRARLGDPRPVRSHTLRAGTAFVLAAVVGSVALTQTASSAPLANAWPDDIEDGIVDAGRELSRLFPFVPAVRGPGGQDFTSNAQISGVWPGAEGVAFTAVLPRDAPDQLYWRAVVFDSFLTSTQTWLPANEAAVSVPAGESVLDLIADPTVTAAREDLTVTITPTERENVAFAPGLPVSFDQPTDVSTGEPSGSLVRVFPTLRELPYEVTATRLVEESADNPDGVSGNKLAAAGASYPSAIRDQYAQKPPDGLLGRASYQFLEEIERQVGRNPYRLAAAIEQRLRSSGEFEYRTNVTGVECGDRGFVECFMAKRVGYCMYFATAMVELLRYEGIPARLVMGYLPGERLGGGGPGYAETVDRDRAHAWVEAYFPVWGWVPFDPTAVRAVSEPLVEGRPVPSPSPGAAASGPPNDIKPSNRPRLPASATTTGGGGLQGLLLAVIGLAVVAAGATVAIVRIRAGRRREIGVAEAYGRVVGLASRLGYGPRPSQTTYEYADALANLVPVARPDLMTVANARVETTYARRQLGADRLAAVAGAARRLRVSLLRLFFRRGSRSGARVRRPPRR